ncbi:metal-binding protein [Chamaesiphon sp. GL140_3_metabinner_50]|uniref:metal-binding protein n=1 Tax=Chamaesiphon sp. GL140_3_metabinner_50 TaxID=2970812 RepID=UPI0025EBE6A7|nr:metal-binding protein [Chamaesiphon sp. GL140_3_metabinner_50]
MPSGRTHDRVTLWSLPILAGSTLLVTSRADLAFWVSSGFLVSGLIFGPDLDLYSIHYKRWGKLRWLWRPYQQALKHRSIWSHGPIIGTIGRIIYLSLWVGLLGLFLLGIAQFIGIKTYTGQQLLVILQQSIAKNSAIYIALFCGLELGAMSHYLSDWLVSTYKRFAKSKATTTPFRNLDARKSTLKIVSKPKKVSAKSIGKSRVK